jgi:hypothetical protein
MKNQIKHGECIIESVTKLPKQLKRIEVKENYFVVGSSETTGNDHRVRVNDNVEFYEDNLGTLYMKVLSNTEVYCPNASRHTETPISTGTYIVKKAREYDFLTQEIRQVRD